jgi:hypothetical protein
MSRTKPHKPLEIHEARQYAAWKEAWQRQVCTDPNGSEAIGRLVLGLSWRMNRITRSVGPPAPTVRTLAKEVGMSKSAVQRCLEWMGQRGHFRVLGQTRGQLTYQPIVHDPLYACPTSGTDDRTVCPARAGIRPTTGTDLSQSCGTKPVTPIEPVAGLLATALGGGALRSPLKSATPQDWWRALQKEFGDLEHVQLERIAGSTVYLVARSPNEAQEIEEAFGAILLERWRRLYPRVNDIRWWTSGIDLGEAPPRQAASR